MPWNKGSGKDRRSKDLDATPLSPLLPPPAPPVVTQTAGMPFSPRIAPKAEPGSLMAHPRGEVSFEQLRIYIPPYRKESSFFFAPAKRLWVQETEASNPDGLPEEGFSGFIRDEFFPQGPASCKWDPHMWRKIQFSAKGSSALARFIVGTGKGKALCATALKTANVRRMRFSLTSSC